MEVKIIGLDKLVGRLSEPIVYQEALRAMHEATSLLHDRIAKYPRRRHGARMEFVSERQRRGFFAKLRSGEITVPYRRTGMLGRSWATRVRPMVGDIHGVVHNLVPYGTYVQGLKQTTMHRVTGWKRLDDVAKRSMRTIKGFFVKALRRAAARMAK